MAGPSNQGAFDLQNECARLQLDEEEEGGLEVVTEVDENQESINNDFRYCLVGRFLTDKVVNFAAMKNTMAALWRPGKGVCIKALSPTLFLFQFFHEIDVRRILDSGPWTFDQHILLVHRLGAKEQPQNVPLFHTNFWIQVYNLPLGFQSERILQSIGNYIGSFLESDENNLKGVWRNYMRLRVTLDVRKPLKRRMRLKRTGGEWFWVDFKYERLNVFCFICGLLGHTDRNCPSLYDGVDVNAPRPYGIWLKAASRRGLLNSGDRWLRTAPPEKEEGNLDSYSNSGCEKVVGEIRATISAKTGNKSRGKEQVGGNVPTFAEPPTLVRGWSQMESNGQNSGDPASGMAIVKANDGHPRTVQVLVNLPKQYKPDFPFLVETLCRRDKLEKLKIQLGYVGLFVVDKVGRSGGLALFWKPNFMVQLLKFGKTFIDVAVRDSEGRQWRITGYYGFPESIRRRDSWRLLRSLAMTSSLPWICLGDFNDLLHSSEKRRKYKHPQWKLHGFQEAISDAGLFDLGMRDWVEERLDRGLASSSWIHLFPTAKVTNVEASCSDHLPIFLEPVPMVRSPRTKKFRFENSWLREPDCCDVVKVSWASTLGVPIQNRLASCGTALLHWGKHLTQDFQARMLDCKRKMALLRGNRDSASVDSFSEAMKRYNELLHSHEIFWKQRAKSIWLKEGDMNSRYFHAMASARKKQNTIEKLRNAQGQWCTTPEDISEIIHKYFTHIFSSERGSCAAQNHSLMEPFSPADVREAIFSMHPDKSPGPDGMNPAFYQNFWSIVGDEVSAACLSYISHCEFPANLNETTVILIPKTPNPESITDFRPIALCNVLYKIVAKMLANRLKLILGSIISDSQSAFIPGRTIIDNIMISAELMHYLKRKRQGKEGAAAFKIDMAKAYDRIEWGFLSAIMLKMGFTPAFVDLIMLYVSTVTYKFPRDGVELGPIVPSRGLWQGDPLSPYLFIICAEGLSLLINHYESAGLLHGVRIARGAPSLTHLFFANDCFLFFKAIPQEAQMLKTILSLYGAASGQRVAHSICSLLGAQGTVNHGSYLGIPSFIGRSKAGKEILLKTVAQAMPNYAMNIYLLPLELCRVLERMMNSFWWGKKGNGSGGITWMKWDRLCKPKTHGGIGFKRLHLFNVAMLGKQGWRLLTNPNTLVARLFNARYYPNTSFAEAQLGSNPSYVWRSILAAQPAIRQGSRIQIGGGQQTSIGSAPWLPDNDSDFTTSNLPASISSATVDSLMVPNQRRWDFDAVDDIFNTRDRDLIRRIPLSSRVDKDNWFWLPDSKGLYSVRSCYRMLDTLHPPPSSSAWRKLWLLPVPAKVKHFLWRALTNVLPTADNLLQRRVEVQASCPICHTSSETVFHVLVTCPFAKACWISSVLGFNGSCVSFVHWLEDLFSCRNIDDCSLSAMVCWGLWLNRNNKVWNDVNGRVQKVVNSAGQNLFLWQQARKSVCVPPSLDSAAHGSVRWLKPSIRWVKCNVDAAIDNSRGLISFGAVIRSAGGDFIAAKSDIFPGSFEPCVAEAFGVKEALSWLKEFAFHFVILEMDSLQVFNALNDKVVYPNGFRSIIVDCRALAQSLGEVAFSFVRRSANSAAHTIARVGHSMSGLGEWSLVPPPWLIDALSL
ncbi:reverse transcriptase domain-containing protein [Citrus sinensis]|uniref:Reverse transcriptase domain-containing protein n=1 Tax=Citrus sinensis TaxID=2711 RepID=A0ACB8NY52_CITSI|nr:reverse transcriptase domain-containing protein [Citrus sinensis]